MKTRFLAVAAMLLMVPVRKCGAMCATCGGGGADSCPAGQVKCKSGACAIKDCCPENVAQTKQACLASGGGLGCNSCPPNLNYQDALSKAFQQQGGGDGLGSGASQGGAGSSGAGKGAGGSAAGQGGGSSATGPLAQGLAQGAVGALGQAAAGMAGGQQAGNDSAGYSDPSTADIGSDQATSPADAESAPMQWCPATGTWATSCPGAGTAPTQQVGAVTSASPSAASNPVRSMRYGSPASSQAPALGADGQTSTGLSRNHGMVRVIRSRNP